VEDPGNHQADLNEIATRDRLEYSPRKEVVETARFNRITGLPLKQILAGLAIRELLAPWTGHEYDFEIWTRLGFYMQSLASPYRTLAYVPGLSFSPFPTTGSLGYPPLSAFIFGLTYRVYVLLGEPSKFLYYFLLKQPMILADVGVAIVLAKIIFLSGDVKSAQNVSLIWLYFPFGIIISSMWGQLDPIALLLSLLATYYFLLSRWTLSAVMLGLAVYLKILPVVFLPVFLLQPRLGTTSKVLYSLVSMGIPVAGTLFPAEALNWGLQGIYSYLQFQAAIPGTGGMSLLGIFYITPITLGLARYFTPFVWAPLLLIAYIYVRKRGLELFHGLTVVMLAFIVSRSFFSEQYMLYPLAFLLVKTSKESMLHFLSLAIASTIFLVANNTLLVMFFSPIFPGVYQWNMVAWNLFASGQSPYLSLRAIVMLFSVAFCYLESFSVLFSRGSIISRLLSSTRLLSRIHKLKFSSIEVRNS
jgi:Mannosyltransferase (PIG-M)